MKPTTVIVFLLTASSVLTIAVWAWALSSEVKPPQVMLALLATALLSFASSSLAKKKIRNARLSGDDATAGTLMAAIAVGFIGACVLVFEQVPSKSGHASHLDRRYSILFFALAGHLASFQYLCSRRPK